MIIPYTQKGRNAMKEIALMTLVAGVWYGCGNGNNRPEDRINEVSIRVEGARCEMCAQTISNAIESIEGMKRVSVDLEKKVAMVGFVEGSTDIAALEHAITAVGYDANDAKRNQNAYEALPTCCQ
jgi:copper chaperone CopZ